MLVKIVERIREGWNYTETLLKEENFEFGCVPLKDDVLYFDDMRCYKVEERRIHLSNDTDKQYIELIVKLKSYA